ncbi:hypothetical protein Aab01nite_45190 [Paractinoplanes abujensis]|uniref:Uncharacterized protein n=1 Tax=Paractinoplanes abujensis TaxID=882441 RepID=A0A7W7G107_9ACTN|nr:hypothetical protein [Actinoplanes abujensis]MBB4690161.1 hypothetical protein [Actinoplanes abujensis]GID20929.1 hypothetical protein Aab01nite_45190 [Actinoplanes abujensis]
MVDTSEMRQTPQKLAADRLRIVKDATNVLLASPVVRDANARVALMDELDLALGAALGLREVGLPRPQLALLATACVDRPGGLRSLAECLDLLESDPRRVHAILRLADEWQVLQQFAEHDLHELRPDLNNVPLTGDLRSFVAERRDEPLPLYCETAWHLFAHLAAIPAADGPAWLPFLERLTTKVHISAQARLRGVVQNLSVVWGAVEPAAEPPAVTTARAGTAYLVIQFEKHGVEDDIFIMSHWYQWASPSWQPIRGEDRRVRRDELETAVDQVVLETERRWADRDGPVAIEFVLPSALLNEPVDRWSKDLRTRSRRLAIHYPLVIRSLERIRAEEWHRGWRGRWRIVREATVLEGLIHCASGDETDVQLEAELEREGTAVVLVLSEPPQPNTAGEQQLLVGLQEGLPAIVWFRDTGSQHEDLESQREEPCEVISEMVKACLDSPEGVAQLPEGVAELRRRAWREDPSASTDRMGHRLVILWDDPDRQPTRTGPAGSDNREVHA